MVKPGLVPQETIDAVSAYYPDVAEAWLAALPDLIATHASRWRLRLLPAFTQGEASWKAPVVTEDSSEAVLKLSVPSVAHQHAASAAPRLWNGKGAVRLLAFNDDDRAMLLERCKPGQDWSQLAPAERAAIAIPLLADLWVSAPPGDFMHLGQRLEGVGELMVKRFSRSNCPVEPQLVAEARQLFSELSIPGPDDRLLHGDWGLGNVLLSARGWLAIDPSPAVGDPASDVSRTIVQARDLCALTEVVRTYADALSLDPARIVAWVFADTMGALGWHLEAGDASGAAVRLAHLAEIKDARREFGRSLAG